MRAVFFLINRWPLVEVSPYACVSLLAVFIVIKTCTFLR